MTQLGKLVRNESVLLSVLAVLLGIEAALALMDRHGVEHLAVIDGGATRCVVGMMSRADILAVLNRALISHKDYKNSDHG